MRLTAEDGYQAQRSYSIASPPEDTRLALTVERLDDGEVSPYLTDELRPGDKLELRGPIGGYFVWEASRGGPLLLVAGGSGIVPLMAMLRHRAAPASDAETRLLYSSRSHDDLIYRDELERAERRRPHGRRTRSHARSRPAGRATRAASTRRCCAEVALARRAAARLRLRADAVRRGGGASARRARPRSARDQDRALRPNGRLRWTS